jgi:hypothetical protein
LERDLLYRCPYSDIPRKEKEATMKNLVQSILFVGTVSLSSTLIAGDVSSVDRPARSCSEMEDFLLHAHPGTLRAVSAGVTNSNRLTMEGSGFRHDAHVQTIDERKTRFEGANGNTELNFRDSYKYNIAAYELAKMLGLNMVPPYVERRLSSNSGSVAWWVNDSMMEADRYKKHIPIPDPDRWNEQMYAVRIFHELVYDTDPNLTNLLITKDWQLWIIDLTRAFRLTPNIREPKNLVKCDRRLLSRLREIDEDQLKQKLDRVLTKSEIHALNARRAKIVSFFDNQIKRQGEDAVLYDFSRTAQACGTGL